MDVTPIENVLISMVAWLALMVISANLLGFFWRGFFGHAVAWPTGIISDDAKKTRRNGTFIALAANIGFFVLLYLFGNLGFVAAALLLMVGRLPDLQWEIRHGRKLEKEDMDRPPFRFLSTALLWTSLPLVWFALYRM